MILHRQTPATPWLLIILFLVISVSSILLGLLYYKSQKNRLLNDKQLELSAIADLKVRQVAQWRNERMGDAVLIGENVSFIKQLSDYLHSPSVKKLPTDIIDKPQIAHPQPRLQKCTFNRFNRYSQVLLSESGFTDGGTT